MRIPPPGVGDPNRLPHAGELFTDRLTESQAFKVALAKFQQQIVRDHDPGLVRKNVLTFYGLGGIGKTALSERLENWVKRSLPRDNDWGHPPATKVSATVRIDLHGSAGQIDVVSTLLALRSGVADVAPRWPVFDLAFSAYWSAVNPGVPLPAIRGSDELSAAAYDTAKDLIADVGSLADLTLGAGAGLGVRAVKKIVGIVRRRRDMNLGIDAYSGFEDFLVRCADEPSATEPRPDIACQVAAVLSWELAAIQPHPLVAVFVDTTERLAIDPRRVSEAHLNLLIHSMPNVLFVLTGRNILTWYDETRVELPFRGAAVWPNLVPGVQEEPRQHLVGNLSNSDTRRLILRARAQLNLPMSDEVVEELAVASAGLPQYLELARQVSISVKDAGNQRQVLVSDVTGSLRSLVQRVLDDIPADEQRAIRAACLFREFDTDLMAAAASVDHGVAERAAVRPMIDQYSDERFPFRMHDAVREAVRRVDHQVVGGWSEPDWEAAATRAAITARRIHDRAKAADDSYEVMQAIGVAITLACDQNVSLERPTSGNYLDWLTKAILFAPSIQGLMSHVPAVSRTEYGRHVLQFIAAKSTETLVAERLSYLREIFESEHPLRLAAGRHLGYALKSLYRWNDALAVFEELVRLSPTELNKRQGPQTLSLARRFIDARAASDHNGADQYLDRVAEYSHGLPGLYFAQIEQKIESRRHSGRRREFLEEMGDFLYRRALFRGDVRKQELEDYMSEVEGVGYVFGIRSCLLATIVQRDPDIMDEIPAMLDRLAVLERVANYRDVGYRYAISEFLDSAVQGDRLRMSVLHDEVARLPSRSRAWIPIEFFFEAIELPLAEVPSQWLEPVDRVRRRWIRHLDLYLARQGTDRHRLRT
jgi:hypothetical protein